jgi:hypothetical protein
MRGAPAFILPLAALLFSASCGAALLCALSALRGTSGGANMTAPGGAGTLRKALCSFLRARRIGFLIGSEFSVYGTPAFSMPAVGALQSVTGPVAEVVSSEVGCNHRIAPKYEPCTSCSSSFAASGNATTSATGEAEVKEPGCSSSFALRAALIP